MFQLRVRGQSRDVQAEAEPNPAPLREVCRLRPLLLPARNRGEREQRVRGLRRLLSHRRDRRQPRLLPGRLYPRPARPHRHASGRGQRVDQEAFLISRQWTSGSN